MTEGVNRMRAFDLEERLIKFAVRVIAVVEAMPSTRAGNHIAGQLVGSGTSPAPNYGEASTFDIPYSIFDIFSCGPSKEPTDGFKSAEVCCDPCRRRRFICRAGTG